MTRFAAGAVGLLAVVGALADREQAALRPPRPVVVLTDPPERAAHARELVRQLGSEAYRDRDRASRELRRMGRSAVAALAEGATDADPEVRARCHELLPAAEADDMAVRLAAFRADPDGPHELPGWAEFRAAVGDDPAARALFAEIVRNPANHHLLRAVARPGDRLAAAVADRRLRVPHRDTSARVKPGTTVSELPAPLELSEAAVLLLAEIAHPARVGPPLSLTGAHLGWGIFFFSTPARDAVAGRGPFGPVFRRLTFRWIDTRDEAAAAEWMYFAVRNQLGTEVVNRAIGRVLALDGKPADKARAVSYLAGTDGREHLPMVVKLFADDAVVDKGQPNTASPDDVQLRDVALLAAVKLTGQEPADFGFDTWKDVENRFPWRKYGSPQPYPWRFRPAGPEADRKRKAAFEKWAAGNREP